MDFDTMLYKCGDFHRYQFMLMGLFCVINVLSSMHYYSQTIIGFVPAHWCYDENYVNKSIEDIDALPICTNRLQTTDADNSNATVECDRWIYQLDYGFNSITTELNWVCQNSWKLAMGQSTFFIGSVVGTLLFGVLADRLGRLPTLIISNLMAFIGNTTTVFSSNIFVFAFCRFVSGMATDSNFTMMYILVLEYVKPSMRTLGLNLSIGLFYCIGSAITPWIAVALGDWKRFLIVTSLPILLVPTFYFIVQESPQWLITNNQVDAAVKCYKSIAKFNRKKLDEQTIEEFKLYANQHFSNTTYNHTSLMGLFKTPHLRRNTLILFFKSMVITLCYDAISRNVQGLGISPFLMFSFSATAILPACIVLLIFQDRIGRKGMASSSLLISGIFTAATGIITISQQASNNTNLLILLSVLGRFGVTMAFNSGVQYATELIPTCVRAQGVSAVHVAGYAMTFFSPYIIFTTNIWEPMPPLILGLLSLLGAVLCLFLPETLNKTIPSTLEDGEKFGANESILFFSCFERNQTTESQMDLHTKD